MYKKYAELRPSNVPVRRFFFNYQNQKCTRQPVGINKFGNIPKQIATFLHLKGPHLYTSHCFRRSSATIVVDAGADITTLLSDTGGGNPPPSLKAVNPTLPSTLTKTYQHSIPSHSSHDVLSPTPHCTRNDKNVSNMQ
ncbi:hypothetical protein NQ315_008984 [Exocentrus adspersus]|uniref:Peptidase A2 domain-containing protein n=1 Tax=Exocentrus adspersus TaxID=1586481 RepID=A0AAV8VIQ8_9CUCU|nr:hypothetical protein NQ315_008984 [Exocentrus adspersus]